MDWKEILINAFGYIPGALEGTLSGLTDDDLNWQPRLDCSSIGWLAWHLTRVEDSQIAFLMGKEQLWTAEGWHARFNRLSDSRDTGFGHTPEQVAEFKSPDIQILLDYSKAVFERVKGYFLSMSESDLDREFEAGKKVGWRLTSVLEDCFQHTGQMGYVRGLRQGKGWQKY